MIPMTGTAAPAQTSVAFSGMTAIGAIAALFLLLLLVAFLLLRLRQASAARLTLAQRNADLEKQMQERTTENALRASEAKYRLLVETSTEVIWTIDEALQFTYISPAIMQLRGLTPEEALHESVAEAICPEFWPRIVESFQKSDESRQAGRTDFVDRMEIQQPHKDGSRVWVEIVIRELYDDQGRRTGALGISRNITARKQAEAQVREYQRQLEAQNLELRKLSLAIEQSGSTIVITDTDGTIQYANPRFEATTGYTLQEALGQNPRILKSGEQSADYYQVLWQTISSGQIWRGEFHNRRKDGSHYWESATIAPVHNAAGQITNYIAIKEDVTESKLAQETLRQYAEQLAAQNAELDAFAHTVAHDLKNPVGIVIGFAGELLDNYAMMSPSEVHDSVEYIWHAGQNLDTIIEEVLLLAGVREQVVVPEPVAMGETIQEACARLQTVVQDKQAHIMMPEAALWPTVLGYAPWIEQVWTNYLSNALKYGGQPPRIDVGWDSAPLADGSCTAPSETSNGQIRFWVRDNGPGLAPEAREKLFEPFTRLEQTRAPGYGLGLSIVRRIVEKLGGKVGLESTPGQGSLFYFTLPAAGATPLQERV